MRPEIILMLKNIVDEDVMTSMIKRLDFYGTCELLAYVDRLDDFNRKRWLYVYNKVFSFGT